MVRVRQEGLGITEAIWLHSHGGKRWLGTSPFITAVHYACRKFNSALPAVRAAAL
ncbi:hypothetical protein [Caballeronia cordobensis]|uniref:hypothetical protein n=1 Tax=Caballeronia cordobensis TaxID=1353886 RepID=UPI000A89981D|nr:hypothetical protein [Caballeronia cordobensis]